jgi:hypothetical protein
MDSKSRINGPYITIGVDQAKTCKKYKGQELSNLPLIPQAAYVAMFATQTAGHITRIYILS